MEFPELGKRCTAEACNLYDFLPYTCVNCKKVFCQDHFKLQAHHCPSLNDPSFDIRVPICPICEKPVPSKRGVDPNIRMNDHIQSNCSDLEPRHDNTCRKKGCTTKMLVPMQCPECGLSYCVKHRLAVDHQCQGKTSTKKKPVPNKSVDTSRAEMERQRRERTKAGENYRT
ncbi:AN1-type zinc finger protein 2B-like protein [Gilbertella persicaria]|uniref:AN1-type zinc finger protein 2B-like protein n=1 Tax=Gilbertella persicaria TaxID=101096 RepID=UPI0022209B57|nr:AN1-type zinc finger protein 2B-like protein [Gilbertella persicaria]KAI8085793.1 AN1-type zinc finger protein 2B-like protein [Gilbertella persicaria]